MIKKPKPAAGKALTGKARPKAPASTKKSRLAVWVDPQTFKSAKLRAVEEERPLGELVEEAVLDYLERTGK